MVFTSLGYKLGVDIPPTPNLKGASKAKPLITTKASQNDVVSQVRSQNKSEMGHDKPKSKELSSPPKPYLQRSSPPVKNDKNKVFTGQIKMQMS